MHPAFAIVLVPFGLQPTLALPPAAATSDGSAEASAALGPRPEPPVVVIAPPAPLPAPPADKDIPDRELETRKLSQGGFEVALGALAYRPDLSRVHFSGSGVPIDGIRGRQSFDHKGSELGMQRPVLLGGDIAIRYLRRYFVLGVSGFIAGNSGGADATPIPANTEATMLVSARSLMAYGGAIDIAGALPLGPATVRLGPVTGVRAYKVDLPGFQAAECKTRRSRASYPCAETAGSNAQPFLQPRVSIDFAAAPQKDETVFVGLSGGVDVFGGASYWGGLALGVRSSHGGLLP